MRYSQFLQSLVVSTLPYPFIDLSSVIADMFVALLRIYPSDGAHADRRRAGARPGGARIAGLNLNKFDGKWIEKV
jgi:hypothetical protein